MAIIGRAEVEVVANTTKFAQGVKQGVEKTTKELRGFDRVTAGLDKHLAGLGITSKDLAVVTGAGLAGGFAFAAHEALQFGAAVVEAASALEEQQAASQAIFASNQQLIRSFAESAASIGLSERAALTATTTFGGFFQNLGVTEDAAAKLAIGFTSLASDAASFFDIPVEDAQQRIISGLRGEQDAVERLNVTINEKMVADRAMAETGKQAADQLTEGEKKAARAKIIIDALAPAVGNYALTAEGLANTQKTLNAEWENAKAALGDILQPVVIEFTQDLVVLAQAVQSVGGFISDLKDDATEAAGPLGKVLGPILEVTRNFGNGLHFASEGLKAFGVGEEEAVDTTEALEGAVEALDDPMVKAALAANQAAAEDDKLADAELRLSRAIEDRTRNVERARERLNRAYEDAEIRIDKAERNIAEAVEDGAERVRDAEEKVAEAIEDRTDRIADAEQKLADEKREAREEEADLRDRLAEAELDTARQIEDAERRLAEARRERARAINQATLSVQQAQAAGNAEAENAARAALAEARRNKDVGDAERDLTETRADREKKLQEIRDEIAEQRKKNLREIGEAEKNLADTIEEQNERVKDAEEDLAKAREESAERIAEAQRNLADAHRDSARAIEDAQNGVTDAIREGEEAVSDAEKAYDRLGSAMERVNTAMETVANTAETLKDILFAPINIPPNSLAGQAGDKGVGDIFGDAIGGHAHGGRPVPGELSWVGEKGPELVRWGGAADVLPISTIARMMKEAMQGGGMMTKGGATINVYPQTSDARVIVNELMFRLAQGVN